MHYSDGAGEKSSRTKGIYYPPSIAHDEMKPPYAGVFRTAVVLHGTQIASVYV